MGPYRNNWSTTTDDPLTTSQDGSQQHSSTISSSIDAPPTQPVADEFKPWLQKQGFKLLEQVVSGNTIYKTILVSSSLVITWL